MKLLLDENVSFKLCTRLLDTFAEVSHVKKINFQHSTDREIWNYAKNNDFAIVTHDADFAEMTALYGTPPKVIWLRCGNQPSAVIEQRLRKNATRIKDFLTDDEVDCLEIY